MAKTKTHKLKHPSSYIVVVLRSLMHQGCVCCGKPIHSYEESVAHWDAELEKAENLRKGERLFSENEIKGQLKSVRR